MNVEQFGNLIPDGRMIHAKFISRKDGTEHEVVGRTGVRKYLTGVGSKFNPFDKGLIPVFSYKRDEKGRFLPKTDSREGSGYRYIPVDNLIYVKAAGITYDGGGNVI